MNRLIILRTLVLAVLYIFSCTVCEVNASKGKTEKKKFKINDYNDPDVIDAQLDSWAKEYADFVSVQELGKTFEGRPIKLLKISSSDEDAPEIWVDALSEAFEWLSSAALLYTIDKIIKNRGTDDAAVLEKVNLLLVPVVNPDGYLFTLYQDNTWSKNRAPTRNPDCPGVNLNRNYSYGWNGPCSSEDPCNSRYAGPEPFSELETKAISEFVLENKSKIKGFISIHNRDQQILVPYRLSELIEITDFAELQNVANEMAKAIKGSTKQDYQTGNGEKISGPMGGDSTDWAKQVAGIKYSFVIHIRNHTDNQIGDIALSGEDVYAAILSLAGTVSYTTQTTET